MNEETLTQDLTAALDALERTRDALEAERARRQDAEHVLRFIAALPAYGDLAEPVMTARDYLHQKEHA